MLSMVDGGYEILHALGFASTPESSEMVTESKLGHMKRKHDSPSIPL